MSALAERSAPCAVSSARGRVATTKRSVRREAVEQFDGTDYIEMQAQVRLALGEALFGAGDLTKPERRCWRRSTGPRERIHRPRSSDPFVARSRLRKPRARDPRDPARPRPGTHGRHPALRQGGGAAPAAMLSRRSPSRSSARRSGSRHRGCSAAPRTIRRAGQREPPRRGARRARVRPLGVSAAARARAQPDSSSAGSGRAHRRVGAALPEARTAALQPRPPCRARRGLRASRRLRSALAEAADRVAVRLSAVPGTAAGGAAIGTSQVSAGAADQTPPRSSRFPCSSCSR